MKADCELALSAAVPELEASIAALKTLKKKEIDEVKSMMKQPPQPVRETLEAIAIITQTPPARVKVGPSKFVYDYYESGK
jgi:hypothetical protein